MFFAGLLFSSCQKDILESELSQRNEVQGRLEDSERTEKEEQFKVFSQTLLLALSNESELRTYMSNKLQQSYDTDYELLYIVEKEKIISNGRKFKEILAEYGTPEALQNHGGSFFDTGILETEPLLSIDYVNALETEISNWDLSENDIKVVTQKGEDKFYLIENSGIKTSVKNFSLNLESILNERTISVKKAETYYLFDTNGESYDDNQLKNGLPTSGITEDDEQYFQDLLINLSAFPTYEVNGQSYHLINHNEILWEFAKVVGPDGFYGFPPIETATCDAPCWLETNWVTNPATGIVEMVQECRYPPATDPGGGDPSDDPCEEECERDCEDEDEHLVEYKINNWGVFENIRNQPFENKYVFHAIFGLSILNADNAPVADMPRYVSQTYRRRHLLDCSDRPCQGRWLKADNYRIWEDWDLAEMGSPYPVVWSEVDGKEVGINLGITVGPKFKFDGIDVQLGSITFGFEIQGINTVLLGDQRVFYCDEIMKDNPTGSMMFRVD